MCVQESRARAQEVLAPKGLPQPKPGAKDIVSRPWAALFHSQDLWQTYSLVKTAISEECHGPGKASASRKER